jgi:hypothetical protein
VIGAYGARQAEVIDPAILRCLSAGPTDWWAISTCVHGLGYGEHEAVIAVKRLKRLGLVTRDGRLGPYRLTTPEEQAHWQLQETTL